MQIRTSDRPFLGDTHVHASMAVDGFEQGGGGWVGSQGAVPGGWGAWAVVVVGVGVGAS